MRSIPHWDTIGRLPHPGDNAAIAIRRLEAGEPLAFADGPVELPHTILEGHRFAVRAVTSGEALLSWSLPFGYAIRDIRPGDYVCNRQILDALATRRLKTDLPKEPNFEDRIRAFELDPNRLHLGRQVKRVAPEPTFAGYPRAGGRGSGTRNILVILGTTSRTAAFAREVARRLQQEIPDGAGLDGVVAVAHTEGAGPDEPHNAEILLRALAGFLIHPNVGAVLACDAGDEPVNNRRLEAYAREHGYPLNHVTHGFFTLGNNPEADVERVIERVRPWIGPLARTSRRPCPMRDLRIALQCGGSDAFSGISGNPLAGWVAREVIRQGGSANLGETNELIGAESYVLQNVRDIETARRFLEQIEFFQRLSANHGTTAEGNPSGGNKLRGLYNINLKSIGAAAKKAPDVRLDTVIDYAERMTEPGFYFMNSPGNDLESVAGQVAAGCNLIFFVTGNGSITNFPFVPTLKFITTTGRYRLLINEMDVNAGAYLDGEPMKELGRKTYQLTIAAAEGLRTKGERAGHSQVSIWRNWARNDPTDLEQIMSRPEPDGRPLVTKNLECALSAGTFNALTSEHGPAAARVGLILPTSLCAGQVARIAAERLTADRPPDSDAPLTGFTALVHTEGCGFAGDNLYHLLARTMRGYLVHRDTAAALVLEHGCEKLHADMLRSELESHGIDTETFGWASIQLDGGMDKVLEKVSDWFTQRIAVLPPPDLVEAPFARLTVGLLSDRPPNPAAARAAARIVAGLLAEGGTVVVPSDDALWTSPGFGGALRQNADAPAPTLAYGQAFKNPGLHAMDSPTGHWMERITGLGGCGVQIAIGFVERPLPGHAFVPVIQAGTIENPAADQFDVALPDDADAAADRLIHALRSVASRTARPKSAAAHLTDFQFTRGLLGVST